MRAFIVLFLVYFCFESLAIENNYYDLFGVSPNSSLEEISRAYRVQAMNFPIHRTLTPEERLRRESVPHEQAMMEEINEAYEVLLDPEKRESYNKSLKVDFTTIDQWINKYPDSGMRAEYAKFASQLKRRQAIKVLSVLVNDLSEEVRLAVVEGVGSLKVGVGMKILRLLHILAKDSSVEVRRAVVGVLQFDHLEAIGFRLVGILDILIKDSDPHVKNSLPIRLAKLEYYPGAFRQFMIFARDPSPEMKRATIEGAVMLGGITGERILDILMKDSDPYVRKHIPVAITSDDTVRFTDDTYERFKVMLLDSDPGVRAQLAKSANNLQEINRLDIVSVLMYDSSIEVIKQVINTTVTLDEKVRIVSQILNNHPDPEIRSKANEFVRSNFPDLFSKIDSAASGSCESGFTK